MRLQDPGKAPRVGWLHLGFALTGIGTTLLGSILPALATAWHMSDSRAGLLFAAQFSGSALGALLVGKNRFGSVMRGYFLLIASAVSLRLFTGLLQVAVFLAFGLGLGLAMTATSMFIGSISVGRRGAALSLLNATWTVGAVLCPAIAWLWIHRWPPAYLYFALAAALAVTAVFIQKQKTNLPLPTTTRTEIEPEEIHFQLAVVFAVLAFLYVGAEASLGGWMMTYVHRVPASGSLWAPIATSGFWMAILCGRALTPLALRRWSEAQLFTSLLIIAFAGTILLLLSDAPVAIALFSALAGLTLGPIYPLCLARVLSITNDSLKAKWVFGISGLGGSLFPWLTGQVSAHSGSLRIGLLVPVAVVGVMTVLHGLERTGEASVKRTRQSRQAAAPL